MMTSTNNINQAVRFLNHDSSDLKMNDYRDRRRSLDERQHQSNYHEETSKRSQHHDQFTSTIENRIKTQDRQIGEADREDEKEQQYKAAVDSLGPYDVICGRGSVAFNNIGNRRFRVLISMNVDRYNNSDGRHRKGLFIGSLVHTFRHTIGARFFKLKNGQLIELTERQIRQKVGHALRDVLAFQESQNQQQKRILKETKMRQQEENNNFRPKLPTTKPGKIRHTTSATLSAIRCRLDEIRKESNTIRTQNHAIPPPLPFGSRTPCSSHTTELRQNPSNTSMDHPSHRYAWNGSTNMMSENSTSDNRSITRNGDARDHCTNSDHSYDNRYFLDHRRREISDSLEPIPIDDHRATDDEAIELLKF